MFFNIVYILLFLSGAKLIYDGLWFSPERLMIQALINESQKNVTGTVRIMLRQGNIKVLGRKSKKSRAHEIKIKKIKIFLEKVDKVLFVRISVPAIVAKSPSVKEVLNSATVPVIVLTPKAIDLLVSVSVDVSVRTVPSIAI